MDVERLRLLRNFAEPARNTTVLDGACRTSLSGVGQPAQVRQSVFSNRLR